MRQRSPWWRLLAVLLGLSILAAACGDDDDEAESSDEGSGGGGGGVCGAGASGLSFASR